MSSAVVLDVIIHSIQLRLLPSAEVGPKGTVQLGGMAHSTRAEICGWQVKLCDPSLTCAIPEHLRDEQLIINLLYK